MQTIRLRLTRPHEAQQQILAESKRFNACCAGRRFGKSRFGLRLVADIMLKGQPAAWCSPSYKMLGELWRETVETLQPVTRVKNESEHRLELITGGVLDMWSLDAPDSMRGRHYARVVVDEAAMAKDLLDIWNLIIRPCLIDLEGDAYFLSTPKGRGDFQTL